MNGFVSTARIIALSLVAGVVAFWSIAWFLTGGGAEGMAPALELSSELALLGWAALAIPGFGAALWLQKSAVGGSTGATPVGPTGSDPGIADEDAERLRSRLIVAWALLEGPALLAGVLFLLVGVREVLWAGALVFLVGMALTYPRSGWFEGQPAG